jgi:hypothetical protein
MYVYRFIIEQSSHPSWHTLKKTKVKLSSNTPLEAQEERYSSYSFMTSALDVGEWSASCPGRDLAPGKDPWYPLYRRLGGPQSRSGHRGYRKYPLPLPVIEPGSPGIPVRSQTLYWLSYPGSHTLEVRTYMESHYSDRTLDIFCVCVK